MKQKVKLKKTLVLLFIGVLSVTTICCSYSMDESSKSNVIISEWWNYKQVDYGKTDTDINDLKYEFQANACIITEEGYMQNFTSNVDGEYIKYNNPKTEVLTSSEKIVTLTKDELVAANQYNDDELKYFKRL